MLQHTRILRALPRSARTLRRTPFNHHHRSLSTLPNVPLFHAFQSHNPSNTAVVHTANANDYSYGNLVTDIIRSGDRLRQIFPENATGKNPIRGERVAFLVENGYDYVGTVSLFLLFYKVGIYVGSIADFLLSDSSINSCQ